MYYRIKFYFSVPSAEQQRSFACAATDNFQHVYWQLQNQLDPTKFRIRYLIGSRGKKCTWNAFYVRPAGNTNPMRQEDIDDLTECSPPRAHPEFSALGVDHIEAGVLVRWINNRCTCNKKRGTF